MKFFVYLLRVKKVEGEMMEPKVPKEDRLVFSGKFVVEGSI